MGFIYFEKGKKGQRAGGSRQLRRRRRQRTSKAKAKGAPSRARDAALFSPPTRLRNAKGVPMVSRSLGKGFSTVCGVLRRKREFRFDKRKV